MMRAGCSRRAWPVQVGSDDHKRADQRGHLLPEGRGAQSREMKSNHCLFAAVNGTSELGAMANGYCSVEQP
jgi:hypothetical protein